MAAQLIARYPRQVDQADRQLQNVRRHARLAVDQFPHRQYFFPRRLAVMQHHREWEGKRCILLFSNRLKVLLISGIFVLKCRLVWYNPVHTEKIGSDGFET